MNKRIILVVSDKFAAYVEGKDAITVSQLRGLLALPIQFLPTQGRTVLVPGQGMSEACIRSLLQDATQSPIMGMFDFCLWHQLPQRAPSSLSHKHRTENTLISAPRQLAEDSFELHFLIDENCELMSDHQTGQHVQGMLLIEAVRQATVAITEAFYIPHSEVNYAFVLNDMAVKYNNFAFPVAATINCRILEKHLDNPRRLSFVIAAEVFQCGTSVSSLTFAIAAMDRARIGKQEAMQAQKTQRRYLSYIEEQLQCLDEALPSVNNF